MSANGGRPTPPTVTVVYPSRCCAKCKTPYGCANRVCACHREAS